MPSTTVGGWTSASLVPGARAVLSPEASLNSAHIPATPQTSLNSVPGANPVISGPSGLNDILAQIMGQGFAAQYGLDSGGGGGGGGPSQFLQNAQAQELNSRSLLMNQYIQQLGAQQWMARRAAYGGETNSTGQSGSGGSFGSFGLNAFPSTQDFRATQAENAVFQDPYRMSGIAGAAAAAAAAPVFAPQGPNPQSQNSLMLPPTGWVSPASYSWSSGGGYRGTSMPGQAGNSAQLMGWGV